MIKIDEMKKLIDINIDRLDLELKNHPKNMLRFMLSSAAVKKELALIKAKVEIREAEISQEIRNNPEEFGIQKITEKAIDHAIVLDKKLNDLKASLLEKKMLADQLDAITQSLLAKGKALEGLVYLHNAGMFSIALRKEK